MRQRECAHRLPGPDHPGRVGGLQRATLLVEAERDDEAEAGVSHEEVAVLVANQIRAVEVRVGHHRPHNRRIQRIVGYIDPVALDWGHVRTRAGSPSLIGAIIRKRGSVAPWAVCSRRHCLQVRAVVHLTGTRRGSFLSM